jgi:nitrate reductase alpha subunit
MKGHEYMLKHYLGTHTNIAASEIAEDFVNEVNYRKESPTGKIDLVVDLNFRMDTSALYSDIVLPAATWYEKTDLNSTDLHTFINPMQAAVPPAWESKSDWDIFKAVAKRFSELAEVHLPEPVRDLVAIPLHHDTEDEISQPDTRDWKKGEVDAIPGKTMPKYRVVERDYTQIYEMMISLGPGVEDNGLSAHGIKIPVADFYQDLVKEQGRQFNGKSYPSLEESLEVVETILRLDPVTNGELAYRAFEDEEKKTGRKLTHLAEGTRSVHYTFADLVAQPRRVLTSPTWSASINKGRAYSVLTVYAEC